MLKNGIIIITAFALLTLVAWWQASINDQKLQALAQCIEASAERDNFPGGNLAKWETYGEKCDN